MFNRHWSSLPKDPKFPRDLASLGYFINPDDEVRSIEEPDDYYHYYISKSERLNDRKLFSIHDILREAVHERLYNRGLKRLHLPVGAGYDEPHVPIFLSEGLAAKKRVVVLFGESSVYLGVLSAMGLARYGGINKSSAVPLVERLFTQMSTADDPSPPGVVIANPGELYWWPGGKRGVTFADRVALPRESAVHMPPDFDPRINCIPGNRTEADHVSYIFEHILKNKIGGKVDVIAVGNMADVVEHYFNKCETWDKMGPMLGSMVILGGFYHASQFRCDGFARFIKERARAYMVHDSPLGTLVAGPSGDPKSVAFTTFGCNVYSGGPDAVTTDTLLIAAQKQILLWMERVAIQGDSYVNPSLKVGEGVKQGVQHVQWY